MENNKTIKTGIDRRGRKYTRQVNVEEHKTQAPSEAPKAKTEEKSKKAAKQPENKEAKAEKPREWWQSKMGHLKLNRYPVGIPESDVTIRVDLNNQEECDSKCVAQWPDPKKEGVMIRVYTKEFLDRNAQYKWERMKNVNSKIIQTIKTKAGNALKSEESNDKYKQSAAIIRIIADTGLRIGQTKGLESTGNKGVSTIHPDDVILSEKGKTIKLNFQGKSYKENNAEIKGDPLLYDYLKQQKESKKGSDRLFDVDRSFVDSVFKNKFGFKGLKLKDMRTYVGTSEARDLLFSDINEFKESLTGESSKDKKAIKAKLADTYEKVSQKLNNTPKMAETAYIHPAVRLEWLKELGYQEDDLNKSLTLDQMLTEDSDLYKVKAGFHVDIDENDEEECDEYNMFDWEKGSDEADDLEKGHTMVIKQFNTTNGTPYFKRVRQKTEEDKDDFEARERKFKNSKLNTQLERKLALSVPFEGKYYNMDGTEIKIPERVLEEYGDVIDKNYYEASRWKMFREATGLKESTAVKKEHKHYLEVIEKIKKNREQESNYNELYEAEVAKYRKNADKRYDKQRETDDTVASTKQVLNNITAGSNLKQIHDNLVLVSNKLDKGADPEMAIKFNGKENDIKFRALLTRIKAAMEDPSKSKTKPLGTEFEFKGDISGDVRINTVDDLIRLNNNMLENRTKKAYKEKYNEDYNS